MPGDDRCQGGIAAGGVGFSADWQSLNAEFMTSIPAAAVPALLITAALALRGSLRAYLIWLGWPSRCISGPAWTVRTVMTMGSTIAAWR